MRTPLEWNMVQTGSSNDNEQDSCLIMYETATMELKLSL